jgi:hypothetical protein
MTERLFQVFPLSPDFPHFSYQQKIAILSRVFHNMAIVRGTPSGFERMWNIINEEILIPYGMSTTIIPDYFKNKNTQVSLSNQSLYFVSNIRKIDFKSLLNYNNDQEIHGSSVLHTAIAAGCSNTTIKYLIEKGADPNIHDKCGFKPICALIPQFRANYERWVLPASITQNDATNYIFLYNLTYSPHYIQPITVSLNQNIAHISQKSLSSSLLIDDPDLDDLRKNPKELDQKTRQPAPPLFLPTESCEYSFWSDNTFLSTIVLGYSTSVLSTTILMKTTNTITLDIINEVSGNIQLIPRWKLEQIVLLSRNYYNALIDGYNRLTVNEFKIFDSYV